MAKPGNATNLWMGLLLLALFLVASIPAHADWLVTRDGKTVETQGAWRVEGKLVKFTNKAGTLSSIRVDEVDLEASRAETARRNAAPAPPSKPAAPKKPVLVIKDADVKHKDPMTAANAAGKPGPIVLYTTSWCGYCRKARALLTALGEPFEDKDIEKSAAARKEYQAKGSGYTGVPLIDFDGTLLRGFNERQLRSLVGARQKPPAAKAQPTPPAE